MTSQLFTPFSMRSITFPNRIMVSPMGQCSADEGRATDWHMVHLGSMALSNPGALCTEAIAVHPNGRNTALDLGLWNDEQAEALKAPLAFCRQHSNVKVGVQLWHVGRKGSVRPAWEGHRLVSPSEGGWEVFGASDIPYPGRHQPTALNTSQIRDLCASFRAAARRAAAIGIDFAEVHGAHGYLLHNFLSPLTNKRTDAYGGSLENRMRFALEAFEAVRDEWPADKPVGMRLSATDWVDGGWRIEDSIELAKRLKQLGCDYITASSGGSVPEQAITIHPGYQVPFARRIREEAGIPTVAVGLITEPRQAEAIIANGDADMVALARGMIFNTRWPWHAAVELGAEPDFPVQYERAHPAMRKTDFLKAKRDS